MPPAAPGSLSADQIYARDGLSSGRQQDHRRSDEINAQTLPKIKMPNRDGFIRIDVKK